MAVSGDVDAAGAKDSENERVEQDVAESDVESGAESPTETEAEIDTETDIEIVDDVETEVEADVDVQDEADEANAEVEADVGVQDEADEEDAEVEGHAADAEGDGEDIDEPAGEADEAGDGDEVDDDVDPADTADADEADAAEPAVTVPAVTGEHPVVAPPPQAEPRGFGRELVIGALLAFGVVAALWGVTEALEIRGQLVEGTELTPEAYLDQVVSVEVDGVEHSHTLAELGWTTEATNSATGRPFDRKRVHDPIEPSGGTAASPVVVAYRSELERDPTAPLIDADWNVVDGVPGVATEVTVDGASPPTQIAVSTMVVEPESSERLEWFVHQRNRDAEGWEVKLLNEDGTLGATLEPEEVAAHVEFDRESATVELVDEAGLRELLEERVRPLAQGGVRGRYEFEPSEDGTTPLIRGGRFVVVDTLTEPEPGKVADVDRAWDDLVDGMQSFGRAVVVHLVDGEDLYNGIDPATLTVKLAESRTPNTGGSRMTNIRNVIAATRGIVVEPGGVFGLNQTTGRRTAEKGYVLAGAIANGEHVDAFGGGVSQTATMFFQAGYMAGLTFPERVGGGTGGGHGAFGHSEYFGRYNNYYAEGWGLDGKMDTGRLGRAVEQTVNYPNREAGFVNTTPYPILVWTFDIGNQVGISLWSLERTRFGVYEGTDSWQRGSCVDWTHYRTVYDMDGNVMFEDRYNGYYRTTGPTCKLVQPKTDDSGSDD